MTIKKLAKGKYPEKTSINLVIKDTNKGNPKLQLAAFALFLVALAAFVRVAVVGKMMQAYQAEQKYNDTVTYLDTLTQKNEDYDTIKAEYSHYANDYLNEIELAQQDRMDVFKMLEICVMQYAQVKNVDITDNTVNMTIGDVTLGQVSQIVAILEADKRVAFVDVTTAGTNATGDRTTSITTAASTESGTSGSQSGGFGEVMQNLSERAQEGMTDVSTQGAVEEIGETAASAVTEIPAQGETEASSEGETVPQKADQLVTASLTITLQTGGAVS